MSLWVDEREIQDVSILRPWSGGAFGPADVALGETLLPHLQRAAAVTRRLRRATLRHEVGAVGPAAGGLAVVLPRRGALMGVSLAVLPPSAAADWSLSRPPAVVAFLRDPSALALPDETLHRVFGLTPAEVDLGRHLLAGRSLRQVSACGSRSLNTLRSHLAHLLAKTGTRRQADLVRLLAELAASGVAGPVP